MAALEQAAREALEAAIDAFASAVRDHTTTGHATAEAYMKLVRSQVMDAVSVYADTTHRPTSKARAALSAQPAAEEARPVHQALASVYETSSALSWGGFNVCGDAKSIAEVNRLVQRVASLEQYLKTLPADPWRAAIDEALIVSCLDCIGEHESPEAALGRLIGWEIQCALDPAISSEAAALIEKGRLEANK